MAQAAVISDDAPKQGHNSQNETALQYFKNRVEIDAGREKLNERADANRQMARDADLVTAALDVEYKEWKAGVHEKEGWKDTRETAREVLEQQPDLFQDLEKAQAERKEKRKQLASGE